MNRFKGAADNGRALFLWSQLRPRSWACFVREAARQG